MNYRFIFTKHLDFYRIFFIGIRWIELQSTKIFFTNVDFSDEAMESAG